MYVYIVLEFNNDQKTDPKVHGVFAKREYALAQKVSLWQKHTCNPFHYPRLGYIAVLRQRVKG